MAELIQSHPALQRIKREALVTLTALTGLGTYFVYNFIKLGGVGVAKSTFNQIYLNIADYFI